MFIGEVGCPHCHGRRLAVTRAKTTMSRLFERWGMRRLQCLACSRVIFYWAQTRRLHGLPLLRERQPARGATPRPTVSDRDFHPTATEVIVR